MAAGEAREGGGLAEPDPPTHGSGGRAGTPTERNEASGRRRRSNRPLFYGVLYLGSAIRARPKSVLIHYIPSTDFRYLTRKST